MPGTGDHAPHAAGRPTPMLCTDGAALCRVRVLSPAEYARLAPEDRPARAAYAPGLGWVVAVPQEHLN